MRNIIYILILCMTSCYSQDCEIGNQVVDCGFTDNLTQGRSNLQSYDTAKSDLDNCPNQLDWVLIGDSNTNNSAIFYDPIKAKTDSIYEVMPVGFIGAKTIDYPSGVQLSIPSATWVVDPLGNGLDGSSTTSLNVGAEMRFGLIYTIPQAQVTDKILIFYEKQANGGDFVWRTERGSTIYQTASVSTVGSGLGVVAISGIPTVGNAVLNTFVTVTNQNTDGVKILGFVATTDTRCGVILHKLGRGGWRADTWEPIITSQIYQDQLNAIGIDLFSIALATNDTNVDCIIHDSAMTSIVGTLKPIADIVLIPPVVKQNPANCTLAEMEVFQKGLAASQGLGLINLYRSYGISADCVERIYGYDGSHYTDKMVDKNIPLICDFLNL